MSEKMPRSEKNSVGGKLYALGVGPGDSDLLTLRAANLLKRLEVVAYPHPGIALKIAEPHLNKRARKVPLPLPLRKPEAEKRAIYQQNGEKLLTLSKGGRDIGVLCEGDPMLYGSFIPLLGILENKIAIEIVPGVNSFTAAAASLKNPLASGLESLLITPAANRNVHKLLALTDKAVLIKPQKRQPTALKAFETEIYGRGYFSLTMAKRRAKRRDEK